MLIPFSVLRENYGVNPRGIIHLGAHLGEEAAAYAESGVKRVVWVEGNPSLISGLQSTIRQFPNQRAICAVVTDQDNIETTFHLASFSMSSSVLPMTGHLKQYPTIVEIGTIPCQSITVDSLMEKENLNINDYDMLNIDLEGAELLALRGATKLLPTITHIYSEVYFEDLYEDCALVKELDSFLDKHGFTRIVTESAYYEGLFKGFGDALYSKI